MEKIILFYNDSPIWGGHEIMTAKIANILSEEFKVYFIYYHNNYNEYLSNKIDKYKVDIFTRTPFPFIRNLNVKHIVKLKRIIEKADPDIVVISQGTIEFSTKGLIASKLAKKITISYIPLVYYFSFMKNNIFYKMRDMFDKLYYKLPDIFITPAKHQSKLLEKKVHKKKIYTIENPVHFPFSSLKREFKSLDSSQINIGYIGRFEDEQKNIKLFIELALQLKKRGHEFAIHMIGNGRDKDSFLKKLKKNKIENNFKFYGWKSNAEIKNILNDIDIVIIPSRYETALPLTFFEVVYHEIPVLVSDIVAFEELNENVKYKNIEDLIQKIITIKNKFIDVSCYQEIKKYILNNYSFKMFKEKSLSVFKELLK